MIHLRAFCRGAFYTAGLMVLGSLAAPLQAAPQYDASSSALPNQSPWNWAYQTVNKSNPLTPTQATANISGGVASLNTSAVMADAAGYFTHLPNLITPGLSFTDPDVVPLDRTAGFEIDFTMKLLSEQHSSTDRAGFSVIALSSDATPLGIELGFWQNEVWAQNAGFTHGESTNATVGTFDTTAAFVDYRLAIQGTGYTLFANNVTILSGSLRDYTAFTGGTPGNPGFPYNQPNFTFFGDDTSSAAASVQFTKFNVVPVPEPQAAMLAVEGMFLATMLVWLHGRNSNRVAVRVNR
jgi:hypothetical protein